jgi:hypothetical protein
MDSILKSLWCPDLRCWFTNRRWSQLRGQRSVNALTGNQLLPNAALKRGEKALIDLVDGLSSRSVVLVGHNMMDSSIKSLNTKLGSPLGPKPNYHEDFCQHSF